MEGDLKVAGLDIKKLLEGFELRYAVWAYIVMIGLTLVAMPLEFAQSYYSETDIGFAKMLSFANIVLMIVALPFQIIGIAGFLYIGAKLKKSFLIHMSLVYVVLTPLITVPYLVLEFLFINSVDIGEITLLIIYAICLLVSGIATVAFGISLISAKKDAIFLVAGAGNVIMGLLLASVFLVIIAPFLQIPLLLLELYLLHGFGKEPEKKEEEISIEPILIH